MEQKKKIKGILGFLVSLWYADRIISKMTMNLGTEIDWKEILQDSKGENK